MMIRRTLIPALAAILLATCASPATAREAVAPAGAPAGTPAGVAELYNKGNAAFRDKDYKTAQNLYLRALRAAKETGVKNSALFNNLATAHMMNGENGKAVLYYKRALRLRPRDGLIRENLNRAAQAREDRIAGPEAPAPFGKFFTHYSYITLNEHAAILLSLFTLLAAAIFLARRAQSARYARDARDGRMKLALAVMVLLQTLLLGSKTIYMNNMKEGVVVGETVTVRSGPNIASERLFDIHDGVECLVINQDNGYIEIQLSTGWKGWIPHQHIEII
jgi:tetratricopeptide (TPR) repeat protein